ncbi:Bacterial regulatory protein, tetR family [Candidatus Izimaplasma bacterium HR1]|jgi:AcrR family transcriptional regulator|uniref:TetR/AcrR family transcriptional regulator n=1 Tax=Candidatus Izimoplasma sp. HR1 TaxID=1541959 RepID=UPI0004F66576|nr:Bacterial regulatory protein, tetR family [Candidatus Izimaplasma bacterium HR1]
MPKETFFNLDENKKTRIIEASLDEFSLNSFNEAKLSRIIKSSKIPRGSFYQYFEDKMDLYKYVFDILSKRKLSFMEDLLPNPEKMPFLELFEELYTRGVKFAESDIRFVRISKYLMLSGQDIIDQIFGDNLGVAKEFYMKYIETDKSLGRIRQDIDTEFLAEFVVQATTNIAFNEVAENDDFDVKRMFKRISNIISILRKGIE